MNGRAAAVPTRFGSRRGARRSSGEAGLATAIAVETVAGAMRSGMTLPAALSQAGRSGVGSFPRGLLDVAAEVDGGASLQAALATWAATAQEPHVAVFVDACRLGSEMGAGLPEALERLGASIRADADLAAELRVLSTPARASVALMLATPAGFGAVVVLPDPALRQVLLGTTWGLAGLGAAGGSIALGAWWMRRLLRSVW